MIGPGLQEEEEEVDVGRRAVGLAQRGEEGVGRKVIEGGPRTNLQA